MDGTHGSERPRPAGGHRRRAAIGGGEDCEHPPDRRTYLGQMGTASFHRCAACGGVVVAWPSADDTASH